MSGNLSSALPKTRVALTGAEHRAKLEAMYPSDRHPRDKKSYTIKTKGGHTATVTRLSKADVERKLAKFEAKYGMTSKEFIVKYHSCGFEEENLEFMDWEWYYYAECEGKYSWEGE